VALVLASGRFAIVTGKTLALDFRVINVNCAEFRIAMAIGAIIGRFRVLNWLGHRHIAIVATKTRRGHTFEYSAFVALFAGYLDVRTNQRKVCKLVIERKIDLECIIGALGTGAVYGWRQRAVKHHSKSHDQTL
jgi:hypothetical protein